jgi:two-component system, OmpR family, sensor histidine kinase TctE
LTIRRAEATSSIRRRLLILLLGPTAALLLVGAAIDYFTGLAPVYEAYDHSLADAALAVAAHVRTDAAGRIATDLPPQAVAVLRTDSADTVYYLVLGPDGSYVAGDAGLPSISDAVTNPSLRSSSYRGIPIRLASYRTVTAAGPVTVTVAETTRKRDVVRGKLITTVVTVDLLQLGAIVVLVWVGVRKGLQPLLNLRDQITALSPRELGALEERLVPLEVHGLVQALNRLFAAVRETGEAQQQFLANAAHQLRTPLSGMQAQLELLIRDAAAGTLRERLEALYDGSRRLARTSNQLLTLARAEPGANLYRALAPVDLQQMIQSTVGSNLDRAIALGIDLGAELQPARVAGVEWLLRELIENLIDNALRYAPRGGVVTARCGTVNGCGFIEVEDNGPGIPERERERVLERFYRVAGGGSDGSGLGLAIVNEIARVHGAGIEITNGAGDRGTRVHVEFPRTAIDANR